MTRGPRIKNIPKRTRAKMLALCHIAGIEATQSQGWSNEWVLRAPSGEAIRVQNHAGYNTWKQVVNHLLGGIDIALKSHDQITLPE